MRIVDLTMELKTGSPVFPAYPTPIVHTWVRIEEQGYYANLLMFVEHTGTHVDSPAHFIEEAPTIDEVPLDRFMGKGVVVDVSYLPPKAGISREIIDGALRKLNVSVGPEWVVLFYTGYDAKAGTLEWFNHPGLDASGAKYLADRRVKAVGIDALSIDHHPFPGHKILLSRGIIVYENLTNLRELLGVVGFKFIGLPLKIKERLCKPRKSNS